MAKDKNVDENDIDDENVEVDQNEIDGVSDSEEEIAPEISETASTKT